ncbi:MAG: hypothetical protein V2A53_08070 [bacterium]
MKTKIKEPRSMAEVHEIRKSIYKETKDMTVREKVEWIHKESEKTKKKYKLGLPKVTLLTNTG